VGSYTRSKDNARTLGRGHCRLRVIPTPPDLRECRYRTVRTKYIGQRNGTLSDDLEIWDTRIKWRAPVLPIHREKVLVVICVRKRASLRKNASPERASWRRRVRRSLAIGGRRAAKMVLRRTVGAGRRSRIDVRLLCRKAVCTVESGRFGPRSIAVLEIEVVVAGYVAWLLRALDLFEIFVHNDFLNHFAAFGINRMGDVGIKLRPALGVFRRPRISYPLAALVTVLRTEMVFHAAGGAMGRQLPAWHRDERAIGAIDDF
jgi:hypothetical protein